MNITMDAFTIDAEIINRANSTTKMLLTRSQKLVTAESCTAGLLAAIFAQADGASDVLAGGFVTYTKAQKQRALGVPARLLETESSVNAEVALAMAQGALERSTADVAVGITGVLGPAPDEDGNPVGLVYLTLFDRQGHTKILRKDFCDRPHMFLLRQTVIAAIEIIDEYLQETASRGNGDRVSGSATLRTDHRSTTFLSNAS